MGKNAYLHLWQRLNWTYCIELGSNLCQIDSWSSWIQNSTYTRSLPGLDCCWGLFLTLSPYIRAIHHSFFIPFLRPTWNEDKCCPQSVPSSPQWHLDPPHSQSPWKNLMWDHPTSKSSTTNEFYQPQTCSRQCGPARRTDLCQRSPSGPVIEAGEDFHEENCFQFNFKNGLYQEFLQNWFLGEVTLKALGKV